MVTRDCRIRTLARAARRAWDVYDARPRRKMQASRQAFAVEISLDRYFKLGLAPAALENQ